MIDETPAETPLAKARLSLEQTVRLVNLLQNIEQRLNIQSKMLVHLQIKIDRVDPGIYNETRAEVERETRNMMDSFIDSLDEAEDRPSQTIIVNTSKTTKPPSKRENIRNLIILVVTAVSTFFIALKESGIIK